MLQRWTMHNVLQCAPIDNNHVTSFRYIFALNKKNVPHQETLNVRKNVCKVSVKYRTETVTYRDMCDTVLIRVTLIKLSNDLRICLCIYSINKKSIKHGTETDTYCNIFFVHFTFFPLFCPFR